MVDQRVEPKSLSSLRTAYECASDCPTCRHRDRGNLRCCRVRYYRDRAIAMNLRIVGNSIMSTKWRLEIHDETKGRGSIFHFRIWRLSIAKIEERQQSRRNLSG